jgi:hypothetical protein
MRKPIPPHDFAKEAALLRAQWKPFYGEHDMCWLEERWARHCLGVGQSRGIAAVARGCARGGIEPQAARAALAHLAEAQRWQHALGAYATGGGEGLACMGAVYEFQMARAWLLAFLAKREGDAQDATQAATLLDDVERDPNGMGKDWARIIREIRQLLAAG